MRACWRWRSPNRRQPEQQRLLLHSDALTSADLLCFRYHRSPVTETSTKLESELRTPTHAHPLQGYGAAPRELLGG